jgi:hypothetical protein
VKKDAWATTLSVSVGEMIGEHLLVPSMSQNYEEALVQGSVKILVVDLATLLKHIQSDAIFFVRYGEKQNWRIFWGFFRSFF